MMKSAKLIGALFVASAISFGAAGEEIKKVRVAWCSKTISAAVAPFAVAQKMGWFRENGIEIELVTFPGSSDCVRNVATGEVLFSHSSPEALALIRNQGVREKVFFSSYLRNIYGLAVPADSSIKDYAGLKGQRIGVTSMSSVGVPIARALAARAGLDPDSDIRIVAVGEPAQSAALLRSKEITVLSQFDTNYALIERAGIAMRRFDDPEITKFPSNGLVALEETIRSRKAETVAFGRAFAMGTLFSILNPKAAVRMLYEVYPQAKPSGTDAETALANDVIILKVRSAAWTLDAGGIKRWGESNEANYTAYLNWMLKWKILPQEIKASDLVTNELIDDINKFDEAAVSAAANAAN